METFATPSPALICGLRTDGSSELPRNYARLAVSCVILLLKGSHWGTGGPEFKSRRSDQQPYVI
jgi:hypothetical protein